MKSKTHKGASKRIKVSKKGKVTKGKVVNSHNKRKQGASKKFRKSRKNEISKGFEKKLRKLVSL